jgi:multidrug efflux pump subunit AcrA (membrane-fusion protein)
VQLVEVVSQGPVEVRLPLSLEDYGYLKRDEEGRAMGEVVATGMIGGRPREWTGTLVRSEEIVERTTRSINVVAEFGRDGADAPAIGMFVKAMVGGRSVPDLVRVPRAAMLDGRSVLLLTDASTLEFRPVDVLRTELDSVLVTGGLRSGERVVTTPPSAPIPGTEVRVLESDAPEGGEKGGTDSAQPKRVSPAS